LAVLLCVCVSLSLSLTRQKLFFCVVQGGGGQTAGGYTAGS
jgi:hypothetical protein